MSRGLERVAVQTHAIVRGAKKKKLDAVVLQSGKRARGQTSPERAVHSSPPSRRKAFAHSLKKIKKKTEETGT